MKMRINVFVGVLSLMILCSTASADLVQWTTGDGGNGHWYEVVFEDAISWTDADDDVSLSYNGTGYLATSLSAEENAFILGEIYAAASSAFNPGQSLWLGGVSDELTGDFSWDNGDTWSWTNWADGEPTGGDTYVAMQMLFTPDSDSDPGDWRDRDNSWTHSIGYIAEYEDNPVPIPGAAWLLGSGLIGLFGYRRLKK